MSLPSLPSYSMTCLELPSLAVTCLRLPKLQPWLFEPSWAVSWLFEPSWARPWLIDPSWSSAMTLWDARTYFVTYVDLLLLGHDLVDLSWKTVSMFWAGPWLFGLPWLICDLIWGSLPLLVYSTVCLVSVILSVPTVTLIEPHLGGCCCGWKCLSLGSAATVWGASIWFKAASGHLISAAI